MDHQFSPRRLRLATISIASAGAALLGLASGAGARVTEIDINTATSQSPTFGGASFGAGQYQMINGTVKGEVDPNDPLNAVIVDIGLAPRNSHGMVEYSTDFQLLIPTDLTKGNHRLLYDITNRGRTDALSILNSGSANTTSTSGGAGNGFLMNEGYSILESGWDITVAQNDPNGGFGVTVPVATKGGKPITGPATEEFDIDSNATSATESLTYPAATDNKSQASLTVRANFGDAPVTLDASAWDYTDNTLTAIKLNPAGTKFGVPPAPGPSALYEFSYTAVNPKVAALGLAAIRDLAAFFRDAKSDDQGNRNPLAGNVKRIYTFCSSQPCRTMHDFVLLGFNEAEHVKGKGRDDHSEHHQMAIDGVLNWKAGGSGLYINYRFSQPTRTHRQHIARWYPEIQFPFANQALFDTVTHQTDGRLSVCSGTDTCPKTFEANSANEYWAKAGSLLTTDTKGNDLDLSRTRGVRYYLFSSQPHGAGSAMGICQQPQNPIKPDPVLRALLVDLDEWVSTGREPPANRVPRRVDGTLVPSLPQSMEGFPNIPNVTYSGIMHNGNLWDFGPEFDDGILAIMPPKSLGTPYPAFVPKTDADGNDIAGIRVPDVAAPIATYTGWALRATPAGEEIPTGGTFSSDEPAMLVDGCDASGQMLAFTTTKTARLALNDLRPSLQERYGNSAGTNANYVAAVTAAAQQLVKQRFLLELPGIVQDVEFYTTPAMSVSIPANP
jgi:hypothetical protein